MSSNTAYIKDEGGYPHGTYTIKTMRDDSLPPKGKRFYRFGELKVHHFNSRRQAVAFCKERGWKYEDG